MCFTNCQVLFEWQFMKGGIDCAIVIESDEETEVGFSCLVKENAGSL